MRLFGFALTLAFAAGAAGSQAQTQAPAQSRSGVVVFLQAGFPTVGSEPVGRRVLTSALGGNAVFADVAQLRSGSVLAGASLLVLPYGSAFPAAAWPAIERYLRGGGNLLLLGGEPLRVPVLGDWEGAFTAEAPQDSYSRALGFQHSYTVPLGSEPGAEPNHFAWRDGYGFLPKIAVRARQVFAEEGRLDGLGYLDSPDGTHLAAPVIVADHPAGSSMAGTRIVALPFTPAPGYWESPDGTSLIRAAAQYAEAGATSFSIEAQYSTLRPGELPELTLHLRRAGSGPGEAKVELLEASKVLDTATVSLGGSSADAPVPFRKPLPTGVYTVRATWTPSGTGQTPSGTSQTPAAAGTPREYTENGFDVEELSALETGPALGTHGDFLSLGDKPFLPVGTNYFTTEENGWDFSGPRNTAVWEHDFADMERHGVNFVRTGVWMSNGKFVEPGTGGRTSGFCATWRRF